jgi:hypothetical protein
MRQIPNAKDGKILSVDELDEFVTREVLTSDLLSGHKADLSKFKNAKGEFTRWVHIFHVSERPTFHDTNLKTEYVLPWCWDSDTLDLEFHRAVAALNGYQQYPMAWKAMSWNIPPKPESPWYYLFASNPSQAAMLGVIKDKTGFTPRVIPQGYEEEFWESMTQFILVPTSSGTMYPRFKRSNKPRSYSDASTGPSEVSPRALREWGHDSSYRPARVRKVGSDPT